MKNNLVKKLGAAALGLAMALSLAACGKDAAPAEIMKTAQEKLADVKSMSYEMRMDMEMSAAGQTINMVMTGKADYIVSPVAMKMDMTMDMGGLGSMETQTYLQQQDNAYIIYTGMDDGSGDLIWTNQTMGDAASLEQYNAQATMDMYLSSADSFEENGTETINGSEATRYDGLIAKDAMNEVMTNSGVLSQLSSLGLDEGTMESMLTDLGSLPISIWVDKASELPVMYEMDMTEIMQNLMTKMMESMDSSQELTISKVVMGMTISNLNGVDSIIVPDAALNAAR